VRLALKVDVRTVRGALVGVPRLAELFRRYGAGASFFSAGSGPQGRAIRSTLRPDVLRLAGAGSLRSKLRPGQLLYGTLLPSPVNRTPLRRV